MARRRRYDDNGCTHNGCKWRDHRWPCPMWGSWSHYDAEHNDCTKSTTQVFGSPRTSYAKWIKNVSLYAWPLWRNRKPTGHASVLDGIAVETAEQIRARQIGGKPRYHTPGCSHGRVFDQSGCVTYSWTLCHKWKPRRTPCDALGKPLEQAPRSQTQPAPVPETAPTHVDTDDCAPF